MEAYREDVRWHIRQLGRLKRVYGDRPVGQFQNYLRDNWPALEPEKRGADGFKEWVRREWGEVPEELKRRHRRREENRRERKIGLAAHF